MYRVPLEEFARIINGNLMGTSLAGRHVSNISIHSKRLRQEAAFFALRGSTTDGHRFVQEALQNGAVVAVIANDDINSAPSPDSGPTILVEDTLLALHQLAAWWRQKMTGKIVGITGSNGKTLVKDALQRILSQNSSCASNPGSFNSQIGVPLSILSAPQDASFALFEAGISVPDEMKRLEGLIRPDFGILTNIGWSHISSFGDRASIAAEKALLFQHISADGWVLIPGEDPLADRTVAGLPCPLYRFGVPSENLPYANKRQLTRNGVTLHIRFPSGDELPIPLYTSNQDVVTDIEIALCAGYLLGVSPAELVSALTHYAPSSTRVEVWKSPTGITVINDSYCSEPLSVQAALRTLEMQGAGSGRRIFVFGGMEELGAFEEEKNAQVGRLAAQYSVDILVLLGKHAQESTGHAFTQHRPHAMVQEFLTVAEAKDYLLSTLRQGDTLLVKGAPNKGIEHIARDIMEAMTANRFYVDLQAIAENVAQFRRISGTKTKILAMVKALAYGSDAIQLATELQHMEVDTIGVASADEGQSLRQAGVELPILVMMCTPEEAEKLPRYNLIPVIYSGDIVEPIVEAARTQKRLLDVHLMVNTGMNRLGIHPEQLLSVAETIGNTGYLRLSGLMTHFASAGSSMEDPFSRQQIDTFEHAIRTLHAAGFSNLLCHASATAGAVRFPEARFDMIRIGLGLYGLYPSHEIRETIELVPAVALVSRIVELTILNKGERIGYNGTFVVPQDGFYAAVVPIGYHDGIPWSLSNQGHVLVNGQCAKICGQISMDSMVIDVTNIFGVDIGTEVLLYGSRNGHTLRPEDVAASASTMVYELLARVGPRVQRIFQRY